MHNGVKKLPSALNYIYDDKIQYERALANSQIVSLERSKVPAVQHRVVGYLQERSRKARSRGFPKPCEAAERTGFVAYDRMFRITEGPIPFERTGKNIVLPDPEPAGNMDMFNRLQSTLPELYSRNKILKEPDQYTL